jgi:hypothetical protein
VLWVFAAAAAAFLVRIAWYAVHQSPRSLGVEFASAGFLLAVLIFPATWRVVTQARRTYRARGLLRTRPTKLAVVLLVVGGAYGFAFPIWVAVDIFVLDAPLPTTDLPWWVHVSYAAKVFLGLLLARTGIQLLRLQPRRSVVSADGLAA